MSAVMGMTLIQMTGRHLEVGSKQPGAGPHHHQQPGAGRRLDIITPHSGMMKDERHPVLPPPPPCLPQKSKSASHIKPKTAIANKPPLKPCTKLHKAALKHFMVSLLKAKLNKMEDKSAEAQALSEESDNGATC